MQPTVLSIAGSDPTGGAGLQADIKTMTSIGVYAAGVVTCITVQNSRGVQMIEPLDPELVGRQIRAVLEDHQVTHIKTGMIATAEISEAICRALDGYTGELIVDPVLVSTTGQPLLQAEDIYTLKTGLIAKATVLTPNLPELFAITGLATDSPENILEAADFLLDNFTRLRAALIKGGHAAGEEEVNDLLLYRSGGVIRLISSTRPFIDSRNTHGTGCVLASAYASYHCLTGDDELAFFNSTNFIQQQLDKSSHAEIIRNPEGFGGLLFGPIEDD